MCTRIPYLGLNARFQYRRVLLYRQCSVFGTLARMGEAALKYVETLSDFVAATIRAEASRRGLTQKDLTRAIGMSTSTMSARWNGLRPWALDELADVAEVFGCSVPELITGDIAQETQNPRRWVAPRGAAARSKGLEPPTF